jgi:hypothetical protein
MHCTAFDLETNVAFAIDSLSTGAVGSACQEQHTQGLGRPLAALCFAQHDRMQATGCRLRVQAAPKNTVIKSRPTISIPGLKHPSLHESGASAATQLASVSHSSALHGSAELPKLCLAEGLTRAAVLLLCGQEVVQQLQRAAPSRIWWCGRHYDHHTTRRPADRRRKTDAVQACSARTSNLYYLLIEKSLCAAS